MGQGRGMGRNMPTFEDFDLDKNGYLHKEEFIEARTKRIEQRSKEGYMMRGLSNMMEFEDIDKDGDGKITPDEFALGISAHREAVGQGQGMGQGQGRGMGRNMPTFAEFDLDKNGYLHKEEFIEARTKRITQRAKEGRMMRGLSNMMEFEEIDKDGDGKITPDEFDLGVAAHRQQHMQEMQQQPGE
jgi:Ca2+-binding EF-hand superfamily protein